MNARELTWVEVQALAQQNAIALVPIGSTEAHGPHLPLGTDVLIAEEVCRRVQKTLLEQNRPSLQFPAVPYGLTEFASGFAGTVSVSAEVFKSHLQQVLEGIARHGFSTVVVVNHHVEPAHFRLVHEAAKAAAATTNARILVPDHRKGPLAAALGDEFLHGGGHAGEYETSLILATAPALVRQAVRATLPALNVNLPAMIKEGKRRFEECGGTNAYFGSPAAASVEEGERLYGILVQVVTRALESPPASANSGTVSPADGSPSRK